MAGAGLILICRIIIKLMVADSYYEAWRFIPVLIIATVFSCFSGFLSSIYMVAKNGKANLFTMMAGALSNIAMNIVFIPKRGAQGAAVATLISYFIVFALRVIGTKKYINVDVSPLVIAVNCLLLGSMSYIMINEIKYWAVICTLLCAVTIAFNIVPLVNFALPVIKKILSKKKKKAN